MEKKIKNQSYVSSVTSDNLLNELHRKIAIVNNLAAVLKEHGELPTLETMRQYQEKGADFKRRAVIDELEAYISKVSMPVYLQESARAEALRQVNNRLISEVGDILDGIDFDLIHENLEYDDGRHEWQFTKAFSTAYLAPAHKVLTDAEQKDFEVFLRFIKDYEVLSSAGYRVLNTLRIGGFDAPEEKLAERFIGSRGSADVASWMFAPQAAPEIPTPQPYKEIEIVDDFGFDDRISQ